MLYYIRRKSLDPLYSHVYLTRVEGYQPYFGIHYSCSYSCIRFTTKVAAEDILGQLQPFSQMKLEVFKA